MLDGLLVILEEVLVITDGLLVTLDVETVTREAFATLD